LAIAIAHRSLTTLEQWKASRHRLAVINMVKRDAPKESARVSMAICYLTIANCEEEETHTTENLENEFNC